VKVGKRDTLASIAQRHQVSIEQIKSWNNLHQDKLASGQKLQLNVPYKLAGKGGSKRVAARPAPSRRVAAAPAKGGTRKAVATSSKSSKKRS
jgi:membrane-bound lytic murein transglycosylase D